MSRHFKTIGGCAVIVASGLVIYLQVMSFQLVGQEDNLIRFLCQKALEKESRLQMVLDFPEHFSGWVPITYGSYITDFLLWGDSPGRHHLNAMFFHILNGLLLFALFQKMTGKVWTSMLLAVLFIIHPLNVESVAYWAHRNVLVSTLFVMLALLAYAYYVHAPGPVRYLLVIFCFALGLMARTDILHLPLILMLLDYWPLKRYPSPITLAGGAMPRPKAMSCWPKTSAMACFFQLFKEKIPLLLMAVGCLIGNAYYAKIHYTTSDYFKTYIFPNLSTLLQQLINQSRATSLLLQHISMAPVSYLGYLEKTLWPVNLSWYLPTPPFRPFAWWETAGAVLLLILITAAVVRARRRMPYLLTGWLWFLIAISPAVVNNALLGNFIKDHYAYFPIIGLFIIVVSAGEALAARSPYTKGMLAVLSTILVITFTTMSWRQTAHWKNQFTLYEHALRIEPESAFLHNNMGKALYEKGDIEAAIHHLESALRYQADSIKTITNLGIAYYAAGDFRKAEACFLKARSLSPGDVDINKKLAEFYGALGAYDKAVDVYKKLLEIRPDCSVEINNSISSVTTARDQLK